MVSYLSQQRYVSFLLGGAAGAYMYISAKKLIWDTTSRITEAFPGAPPAPAPAKVALEHEQLFGPGARAFMVRKWNQTVDAAFRPIIRALVDRDL